MDAKDRQIAELKALLKAALEKIERLEAEIATLRAAIAVLQKNSGNSSKPPSSDIVKPPRPKGKRKRKIGAQKGHKRNVRKPFGESELDKIIEFTLDNCPKCNGTLQPIDGSQKKFQQVEHENRAISIIEYRYYRYRCEHCKHTPQTKVPAEIKRAGLFGPNLVALTAYLKGRMRACEESILKSTRYRVPANKNVRTLSNRLRDEREEYFRFIESGIPPTNNLCEQSIRQVVIDRKITQGTRSEWGNRWNERIWSVLATCNQQSKNVMDFLKSCVGAVIRNTATPLLRNG
jgi:hypothetical protein